MNAASYYALKKKRSQRRLSADDRFDTTAVADLSFNLLIFFIVTASFILRQGIFITLPSPGAGAVKVEASRIVELYPSNDGYLIDGTVRSRADAAALLKERRSGNPGIIAIIFTAPDLRYERLVDALSIVRETGITKMTIREQER